MASLTRAARPARSFTDELATVLPASLLILLMSGAVIWSLAVSSWAPGLEVLRPLALLALLTGMIFARLPWLPGWLAHPLSAVLALTWAVQLLGGLMDAALLTWRDRGIDLVIRTVIWGRVIASGGRGEDILLFVLALCLLAWALSYATAWMVLRHGWTWRPIVLNAVVALVNYTYVLPKPTLAFFVFLCAALLLLVYQHVRDRQVAWDAQGIAYPDLLAIRSLWSAALVCGVLIMITANLPGEVSIDRATRTWSLLSNPFKTARERWEDLFSTINAPPGAGSGAFTTGTAALGGSRQLSSDPVMEVRSTEYDYWRATAFDKYTGQGWQNTVGEQARALLGVDTREQARSALAADEPIPLNDVKARRSVAQHFTMLEDRLDDLVMVGGSASQVNRATLVEHNYLPTTAGLSPNFDETSAILATERLRTGQSYTVTALVSFADVAGLRAAGTAYPAWVRERYLQLPERISERTRDLAIRLISETGAATPYDTALVLQDYLRTLPYNERIPSPPATSDHVDWFLFEQREGYCDYFASAMVVLLRTQGIPARWVRGYAGGEFDAERGVYVVREQVAHSWPEVYFPGYGWERFEPTPADYTSPPDRPLTAQLGSDPGEDGLTPPGPAPDPGRFEELDEGLIPAPAPPVGGEALAPRTLALSQSLRFFAAALGLLALLGAAFYGRWRYERRGLSQVQAAYAGMTLLAGWGGLRHPPQSTPQEYAAMLVAVLPVQGPTIEGIAAAYVQECYGGPTAAPGLYRGAHISLPPPAAQQALWWALVRHIFTGLPARLPVSRRGAA